jgi:uncharacterized protein (DUF58 family)
METDKILKKVRKIEIRTKRLVDGLMSGAYHSVFKGRGIEFSEVREYSYGDDIRAIDWNVTARMNHPFVKEFIEERDLTVYIVFDVSASSSFGSETTKKDYAIELAASLMFSAIRNNDNVGLALFTTGVESYMPPRKGKRHVLKLLRELVYYEPKNAGTDLEKSLIFLSRVIKRRSIIFIISDFYSGDFVRPLQILKKKHDIIALNLHDPREREIPPIGFIELEDSETGEQILVDTSDREFRESYAELVRKNQEMLEKQMQKAKVDLVQVDTNAPFEVPLRKFFRKRVR